MFNEKVAEPPRPDPAFKILVIHDDGGPFDATDVTHAVMDVYDMAINSMDFGSGFMSTEEVGNLRKLGKAIGAARFDYQHDKCLRCGHDYDRHHTLKMHGPRRCHQSTVWAPGAAGGTCECPEYIRSEATIY